MSEVPAETAPAPLEYEPGIDGLRAVAVVAVLFFHARFDWARGGFLGVSMFFTLSGFLITSLLLREYAKDDGIDLRRFWGRRYRRLLPASLAVAAGIALMAVAGVWNADQLARLFGDALASLLQVANWRFILEDTSYGASFTAPSPFEHFWSLAIEEQFYLLFPLVVAAALRRGRGGRRVLVGVLGALTVASATVTLLVASSDVDRVYFGTDTRLAELTIGALAACVVLNRLRPRPGTERGIVLGASAVGLAILVVLFGTATVGSQWLYPWGLLLTAVATVAVISGAMSAGPLRAVLSTRPMVGLGRISYGVYLIHWPVFLWLTPVRVGWDPIPLFVLRSVVTVALAAAMFRLLERPVRARRLLVRPAAIRATFLAGLIFTVGTVAVATDGADAEPEVLSQISDSSRSAPTAPPPAQRVLVVGDQMAEALGPGLATAGSTRVEVRTEHLDDCGIVTAGFVKVSRGDVERDSARCRHSLTQFVMAEAEFRPDVVVVWAGVRDAVDRRLSATSPWITPLDEAFGDLYRTSLREMTAALGAGGAEVIVLPVPYFFNSTPPGPTPPPDPTAPGDVFYEATQLAVARVDAPVADFVENDPVRVDRLNSLMGEVVADDPDLDSHDVVAQLRSRSTADIDFVTRPDGVVAEPLTAIGLGTWLQARVEGLERATVPPEVAEAPADLSDVSIPPAPAAAPRTVAPRSRAARTLVLGDSVAVGYAAALGEWGRFGGGLNVSSAARFACPLVRGGQYRYLREVNTFDDDCDWEPAIWKGLETSQPDVVLLTAGIWDVVDRLLPNDDQWRHVGEADFDAVVLSEMISAVDLAASQGATVTLLTYPHFEAGRDQGYVGLPESDPARIDRLNDLMRQAAAERPAVSTVVDFQAWLALQPGGELDPAKRLDGLHFSEDYLDVIAEWLGPQLVTIARG